MWAQARLERLEWRPEGVRGITTLWAKVEWVDRSCRHAGRLLHPFGYGAATCHRLREGGAARAQRRPRGGPGGGLAEALGGVYGGGVLS